VSDATGPPSENSLSQFYSNGKRRTSAAAAENDTLFFIQYYTRTTLDLRAVARLFYTSTSAQKPQEEEQKWNGKIITPDAFRARLFADNAKKRNRPRRHPRRRPPRARARGPPLFV